MWPRVRGPDFPGAWVGAGVCGPGGGGCWGSKAKGQRFGGPWRAPGKEAAARGDSVGFFSLGPPLRRRLSTPGGSHRLLPDPRSASLLPASPRGGAATRRDRPGPSQTGMQGLDTQPPPLVGSRENRACEPPARPPLPGRCPAEPTKTSAPLLECVRAPDPGQPPSCLNNSVSTQFS